ncbi:MAG: hypothetical protein HY420_02140 [Candidatus Kerfeldbacteria bacterium]|nr:hypothetical protein [Candidatus Kerfeldbacteria bacterium]
MSKKLFAAFYALALALAISPLSAVAQTNGSVSTGFTRSTGGGEKPIIKVKWEMRGGTQGADDSIAAGAQLLPSGQYQVNTSVTYCAVATDPDGLADINAVYADVFYPEDVSFHNGASGCHEPVHDEVLLSQLSKANGLALICDAIRNNNNNLPEWATGYDYAEICAQDGELQKETAAVYCGTRELSYEDPDGMYWVDVHAADKAGLDSDILQNKLVYLPLTAFAVDFTSVDYGNVKLNTHKIKNGNLTFSNGDGLPTVRNTGNTRMTLLVKQDDMGLGTTNGVSNVEYDGRVGSDATFSIYNPGVWEPLENTLELSEDDEVDFSILVKKFPNTNGNYTGTMQLDAQTEAHPSCGE